MPESEACVGEIGFLNRYDGAKTRGFEAPIAKEGLLACYGIDLRAPY